MEIEIDPQEGEVRCKFDDKEKISCSQRIRKDFLHLLVLDPIFKEMLPAWKFEKDENGDFHVSFPNDDEQLFRLMSLCFVAGAHGCVNLNDKLIGKLADKAKDAPELQGHDLNKEATGLILAATVQQLLHDTTAATYLGLKQNVKEDIGVCTASSNDDLGVYKNDDDDDGGDDDYQINELLN